jgi:glucosamine-6-phosphate deaminase
MSVRLLIEESPLAVGERGAELVAAALGRDPALVLGLITGATALPVYAALGRRHREGGLSFARATSFNLDEYVGLTREDPLSCAAFMQAHLFGAIDLDPARAFFPDVLADGLDGACAAYEAAIARAGGIDLQLLGIGRNGHLGMNEPGAPLEGRTRTETLTEGTLADNARQYAPGTRLPARGVTLGLGTILDAREIVLLAFGAHKAPAIAAALEGPISPACPASVLRRHPRVTAVIDRAAAARLRG